MDGEFLNHGVGEQLGGELRNLLLCGWPGQLDLEALALADAGNLVKTKPPAGTSDRLALRVMDLGLEHDIDDESRHIPNSTRAPGRGLVACGFSGGRAGFRGYCPPRVG